MVKTYWVNKMIEITKTTPIGEFTKKDRDDRIVVKLSDLKKEIEKFEDKFEDFLIFDKDYQEFRKNILGESSFEEGSKKRFGDRMNIKKIKERKKKQLMFD